MSIRHLLDKIKNIAPPREASAEWGEEVSFDKDGHIETFPLWRRFFLSLVIILIAFLSFGIGRLSVAGNREPIRVEYDSSTRLPDGQVSNQTSNPKVQTANVINVIPAGDSSTTVVGSSKGTKYHYSHCAGAKQIKEENKLVFASSAAAEASGYTLAANCSPR